VIVLLIFQSSQNIFLQQSQQSEDPSRFFTKLLSRPQRLTMKLFGYAQISDAMGMGVDVQALSPDKADEGYALEFG
jgi:hypothetical protein